MTASVAASFEVTDHDLRAWINYAVDQQGQVKQSIRAAMILMPILAGGVGWLALGGIGALFGAGFGLVAGLLVLPILLRRTISRRIEQAIAQQPDGVIGPHTVRVEDDRLIWSTTVAQCAWKRSAVRRVHETDDHAFVMFAPENALVLPLHRDSSGDIRTVVAALTNAPPPIIPS